MPDWAKKVVEWVKQKVQAHWPYGLVALGFGMLGKGWLLSRAWCAGSSPAPAIPLVR